MRRAREAQENAPRAQVDKSFWDPGVRASSAGIWVTVHLVVIHHATLIYTSTDHLALSMHIDLQRHRFRNEDPWFKATSCVVKCLASRRSKVRRQRQAMEHQSVGVSQSATAELGIAANQRWDETVTYPKHWYCVRAVPRSDKSSWDACLLSGSWEIRGASRSRPG